MYNRVIIIRFVLVHSTRVASVHSRVGTVLFRHLRSGKYLAGHKHITGRVLASGAHQWRRKSTYKNILFCSKFIQKLVRVFARTAIILCAMQEKRGKNNILF